MRRRFSMKIRTIAEIGLETYSIINSDDGITPISDWGMRHKALQLRDNIKLLRRYLGERDDRYKEVRRHYDKSRFSRIDEEKIETGTWDRIGA